MMTRKTTPIQAQLSRRRPRPAQRVEGPDTRPFAALRDRRAWGAWGARGARGFSLLEVLVSLGIFAVGLIAVSAVFPTAITIQRETVRTMDGRRVAQNAKTMILAITRSNATDTRSDDPDVEISYNAAASGSKTGSLLKFIGPDSDPNITGSTSTNPSPVMPMIDQPLPPLAPALRAPESFHGLFNLDTRSYPKNFYATNSSNNDISALRRDYYWYPLIQAKGTQQGDNTKWFMFLIVMHRSGSQAPPEVRRSNDLNHSKTTGNRIEFGSSRLFNDGSGNKNNDEDDDGIPDYIQPGDRILADDGKVHTVILADENGITVNSPSVGNPGSIYFAVAIDGVTRDIKTETRSPMVWIEESISLSVNK